MPPIINSSDLGQIDSDTTNILIEVTGTDHKTVNNVLEILALIMTERSGKLYSVAIDYTYRTLERTPAFATKDAKLKVSDANELLGIKLSTKDIVALLNKMGYDAQFVSDKDVAIKIPSHRLDIMHPVDVIEDIAIAYGYNKFTRKQLDLPVSGGLSDDDMLMDKVRELCIGLGGQEILNFNLTDKESLFLKTNLPEEDVIDRKSSCAN